jgi:adenine-specific DNA-methyltransferase
MEKGASDLYLAFVEQAMRLAGKSGRLAFIMPNFSRTATGGALRNVLCGSGAVERWVDFSDIQIFQTATNYVALLFATARKRRRKTFQCVKPSPSSWPPDSEKKWIDQAPRGSVHYGPLWRTFDSREAQMIKAIEKNSIPLGEIVKDRIGVGVQTSADDVFILKELEIGKGSTGSAYSSFLKKRVNLEKEILKPCAKGSLHLRSYHVIKEMFFLWPYDSEHQLLDLPTLEERFPMAWKYLKKCESRLRCRENNRFDGPDWWRFGRDQGFANCCSPKLMIPSTMNQGTAFFDEKGEIAYTASGKGGGGAYGIMLDALDKKIEPRWLLAVLNSDVMWQWIRLEGDPKKGGWRGIDKALISRLPIPVPLYEIQMGVESLTSQIDNESGSKGVFKTVTDDLNKIVAEIFNL